MAGLFATGWYFPLWNLIDAAKNTSYKLLFSGKSILFETFMLKLIIASDHQVVLQQIYTYAMLSLHYFTLYLN